AQLLPLHLLAALLDSSSDGGGIVVPVLEKAGAPVGQIRRIAQSELKRMPTVSGGSLAMSSDMQEVLRAAEKNADAMKDQFISAEHLLLALLDVKSDAKEVLTVNGVDRKAVLGALQAVRGSGSVTSQNPEDTYQALARYGRDLVAIA